MTTYEIRCGNTITSPYPESLYGVLIYDNDGCPRHMRVYATYVDALASVADYRIREGRHMPICIDVRRFGTDAWNQVYTDAWFIVAEYR